MPTALITGVCGQDGVYLARHLLRHGYRVLGTTTDLARSAALRAAYLPTVDIRQADIRDSPLLLRIIEDERPDEVYNLAAWSSVGRSWDAPAQVTEVNGLSVLGLLEGIRHLRDRTGYAPRFCQASSSEMFGLVQSLPQTEQSPHHPRSPYAVAKSFAHHTTVNHRESYGLFLATAILFNHESPLRPDSFVTRKITKAAAAIALGRTDHLTLGRLDVRRDWGSAPDYVVALRDILQLDEPDDVVVATGTSHSLADFIAMAFAAAGLGDPEPYLRTDPSLLRPADVPETRGDPRRAAHRLAWKPTIDFPTMVESMVAADLARLRTGVEHDPRYLAGG